VYYLRGSYVLEFSTEQRISTTKYQKATVSYNEAEEDVKICDK
jgi:hypothetical protein